MNRTRLVVLAVHWLAVACAIPEADEPERGGAEQPVVVGTILQAALSSSCPEAWWMDIVPPVHGEDRRCTFTFQGKTREYFVHIPPPSTGTRGVLLEMHGGGGWAPPPFTQIESGWEQVADTEALNNRPTFYVVWPTGRGPATQWWLLPDWWTCEYKQAGCPPVAGESNERDFLAAVVENLKTRTSDINAKRVYAAGLSSGAAMTHMLACDHSSKFAAVASMAGGVFSQSQAESVYNYDLRPLCNPTRKVPHFYAHAMQDQVVPFWEGEATVTFWKNKLGCAANPSSVNTLAPDDADGINDPTICRRFSCQSSSQLEFCALDASANSADTLGGHRAWFGDDLEQPSIDPEVPGAPHRLARLAWNFMSQFTLP